MIQRKIKSRVEPLIRKPFDWDALFQFGMPLATSDGDLLYTTDNDILVISGSRIQSRNRPVSILVTDDRDALFTNNYDLVRI